MDYTPKAREQGNALYKTLSLTLFTTFCAVSLGANIVQAADTFVPAPCSLKTGQSRTGGASADTPNLQKCDDFIPQALSVIQINLENLIRRHQSDSPDRPGNPNLDWRRYLSMGQANDPRVPACSLIPLGPQLSSSNAEGDGVSGNASANSNLVNQNCGNWCSMELTLKSNILDINGNSIPVPLTALLGEVGQNTEIFKAPLPQPSPTPSPLPSPSPSPSPQFVEINIDDLWSLDSSLLASPSPPSNGPACSREDSFIRGAALQAIKCKQLAAAKELNDNWGITIKDQAPGVVGTCQPLADDLMNTINGLGQGIDSLLKKLGEAMLVRENLGDCSDSEINPNQSTALIAPCLVTAAEKATQGAFNTLVSCKALDDARLALNKILSVNNNLFNTIRSQTLSACASQCKAPKRGDIISNPLSIQQLESQYESCAQSCYQTELPQRIKAELNTLLPLGPGGCPNA